MAALSTGWNIISIYSGRFSMRLIISIILFYFLAAFIYWDRYWLYQIPSWESGQRVLLLMIYIAWTAIAYLVCCGIDSVRDNKKYYDKVAKGSY